MFSPNQSRLFLLGLLVLSAGCGQPGETSLKQKSVPTPEATRLATRTFDLHYSVTVSGVPAGASLKIWVPLAESNAQQEVEVVDIQGPVELQEHRDPIYGNKIGHLELAGPDSGSVELAIDYRVVRQEASIDRSTPSLTAEAAQPFLQANTLVPIQGRPLELLAGQSFSESDAADKTGRTLYEVVFDHVNYDKSQPGYGNGDVNWVCDSRTGNCTDFHSLFISLARSRQLPAKFEIGFPVGPDEAGEIGGYHCWAWFHVDGQGWLPVDISEADKHPEKKDYFFGNLTADRIAFSTGRDIVLVPAAEAGPRNYFVYPHVEVDGQPWPADQVKLAVSYRDAPKPNSDSPSSDHD